MGAKPEFKDFGMQVLSLNSELATGMVWFNLSTDLLSGRSLHALELKVTVGMPRVEWEETGFGIVLQKRYLSRQRWGHCA